MGNSAWCCDSTRFVPRAESIMTFCVKEMWERHDVFFKGVLFIVPEIFVRNFHFHGPISRTRKNIPHCRCDVSSAKAYVLFPHVAVVKVNSAGAAATFSIHLNAIVAHVHRCFLSRNFRRRNLVFEMRKTAMARLVD